MKTRNSWLLKKGQKGKRRVEEKRECLKVHVHRTLTPHSELDQEAGHDTEAVTRARRFCLTQ
jgi:hypothetical protein